MKKNEKQEKQMEDSREVIGEIQKNTREVLQVSINQYKGHRTIDQRVWSRGPDDTLRPTKKGISLNPTYYPQLLKLIEKAMSQITQQQV